MFFQILTRKNKNRDKVNIEDELDGRFLASTLFHARLRQERLRAERSNQPLCIVIVDVKQLIDILTKKTGISSQRILRRFGHTIEAMTRECDIKGWLKEETIAILTPDTDDNGARSLVRKLAIHLTNHLHLEGDNCQSEVKQRFIVYSLEGGRRQLPNSRKYNPVPPRSQEFYRLQFPFSNTGSPFLALSTGNAAMAIDNRPFASITSIRIHPYILKLFIKRIIDIIGSLVGIVVCAPLMMSISIFIKVTSPGPVIFKQQRLGLMGKPITFLKFRSMAAGSDNAIHKTHVEKLIQSEVKGVNPQPSEKPVFKLTDDPRITPVGKFLRKTSLDELPQLFNVLKGDMSLVGPRPHPIYECELYKRWHWRRIWEVKPGITGLWQVNGRLSTTYDEQIRLDLTYVRTWNLWLDLKILIKTFWTVLSTKGAV